MVKFRNEHPDSRKVLTWVALACILFLILHVGLVFLGWYGNDDINYARWAASLNNDGYLPLDSNDHFVYRWLPIGFTALAYRWMGVNDFSSAALSLLSTVLVTVMLYRYLLSTSRNWWVLVVFSLQYTVVFYAHRLLPDSVVMMLGFAAYLAYWRGPNRFSAGLLAVLALGLAFLAKETMVLMVPVWLGLLISDLVQRRAVSFWKGFCGGALVLLGSYFLFLGIYTGDPLQRWHALQTGSYFNECSYDQLPRVETFKRIGYGLGLAWLNNGDLLLLAPAGVAWFYRKRIFQTAGERQFFGSFPLWILAANFMSVSFHSYVPMCPDPRHFLFIMPLAAYGAGTLFRAYLEDARNFPVLPVVMCVLALIALGAGAGEIRWLYLAWAVWLGAGWLWQPGQLGKLGWMAGILVLLLARPVLDFFRETYPRYKPERALIKEMVRREYPPGLVWTPAGLDAEIGEYILAFQGKPFRFAQIGAGEEGATYLIADAVLDKLLVDAIAGKGVEPILTLGSGVLYNIGARDLQQWVLKNAPK